MADAADLRPWIVTRPAVAGESLTAALRAQGRDAWWLPAFDLGPAPDPAAARAALDSLGEGGLALFVSPAAVRAAAALRGSAPWPAAVTIAAVGAGTGEAVRAHLNLDPVAPPPLIAPDVADANAAEGADSAGTDAGSEALWPALQVARAGGLRIERALLLRAEHGRDWLLDRLREAGIAAQAVAVYARRARAWSAADREWLQARAAGPAPVLIVTSSEAVDALSAQAARADPALLAWLQRGRALALHPRIVDRLHAAGFADACCVPARLDALLAAAPAP